MTRTDVAPDELERLSQQHLWGHFSPLSPAPGHEPLIIERGDGCYVWDHHGNRYLDALAGLFTVQAGHGRVELAEAAAKQAAELAYFPIWTFAHPTAIELAARLAELAPGDLNRVFFTTGGSEAVEVTWKLARQYFKAIGQPGRYKAIARNTAYHGVGMGALSLTGVPSMRAPFEPLVPGGRHVATTNRYRCDLCAHADTCTLSCADDIERTIIQEGPESVAMVILEPVQNAGGCFTPTPGYFERVREICDRYGVLLVSDEVICAFGRLGTMFGAQRVGAQPDMITMAKGLTSGYSPLGGVMVSDRIAEPFLDPSRTFLHGITFAAHPVSCAVALANLDIFERDDLLGNVTRNESAFREAISQLEDLPWVGEVRGMGYFWAVELVKDKKTKETFTGAEADRLLRGLLSPRMFTLGLYCRADDRGDPIVQLAPPLIAGPEEFDLMAGTIRQALIESMEEL
jgi:adenosylmethionine-8-amino-7-oxononanoate aminotransferase